MSAACEQEMCQHWTGEGCACAVFGIDRVADQQPVPAYYVDGECCASGSCEVCCPWRGAF